VGFAVRSLLLVLLGFAFSLSIRLAVAEVDFWRNPDSALHSPFWLNAANLARYNSSPKELCAALRLNPRLASAWMYLGLDAEAEGHLPEAEADLLQAARIDRQYLPAWTLANFYFRRDDPAQFWVWAGRAALLIDDPRPLLRLTDAFEASPQRVATRLGGRAPLLRAYLDLLIGAERLDSAQEIARMLLARHEPSDQARLADFAARLRRAGISEASH
jgi:tetratricopeptide (TPR) repeat protein